MTVNREDQHQIYIQRLFEKVDFLSKEIERLERRVEYLGNEVMRIDNDYEIDDG